MSLVYMFLVYISALQPIEGHAWVHGLSYVSVTRIYPFYISLEHPIYTTLQRLTAVTAYFTLEQLLWFVFTELYVVQNQIAVTAHL